VQNVVPPHEQDNSSLVASYKKLLSDIVDRQPSGTRQRLAAALSKNRSFISQISSPTYSTPIPANHLDVIFEICRFSAAERAEFLELYRKAHPSRHLAAQKSSKVKAYTFYLPDLGEEDLNREIHALVTDFVRQVVDLAKSAGRKGKRS
jgi:hypothetical protein